MNTQRRPVFAPGMRPRLARLRSSSGCIFKNSAASSNVMVFMIKPDWRCVATWSLTGLLKLGIAPSAP